MILNFLSPCWQFEAVREIPRGSRANHIHYVGSHLVMVAPIDIKPGDIMTVDLRNGHVETITRKGIAIWRSGWLN